MATLKDIARRLNVSVTQVSRALNGHADVSDETRRRVTEAANQLKYHPNISARKLVSGRSGMVALVVQSRPGLSSDRMFFEVVSGLSEQFSGQSMQFVLHIAQDDENILNVYQRLSGSGSLDGFVLTEPAEDDPRIDYLRSRDVPFVVHGRNTDWADYPYFDIDNHDLARAAVIHFAKHGHDRIALINGPEGRSFAKSRLDGYRAALAAIGAPYRADFVHHGWMDEALGLISVVRMFTGESPYPTAIFCSNMLIAKGVYEALAALGRSVPRDVSVIAHDDVLPDLRASAFYPPLTVTRSPLRESWTPLAGFLGGAINGEPVATLQRIAMHSFIERSSVADRAL
jgi:LacI family transcriptional regulator